jgi:hypothetical protein
MPSVLWAGQRGKGPVRMTVGVQVDDLEYELSCGLMPPVPGGSAFDLDPHMKEERLRLVDGKKRTEPRGAGVRAIGSRLRVGLRAAARGYLGLRGSCPTSSRASGWRAWASICARTRTAPRRAPGGNTAQSCRRVTCLT